MELQLKIAGILMILLALFHAAFPVRFKWKTELVSLNLLHRQMFQVHTFFIALSVLLMGLLCFAYPAYLINTYLGNKIVLGLFIFWAFRMLFQFFVYSPKLWKGKKFETFVHIMFSLLWIYFAALFFYVYWTNRNIQS